MGIQLTNKNDHTLMFYVLKTILAAKPYVDELSSHFKYHLEMWWRPYHRMVSVQNLGRNYTRN